MIDEESTVNDYRTAINTWFVTTNNGKGFTPRNQRTYSIANEEAPQATKTQLERNGTTVAELQSLGYI